MADYERQRAERDFNMNPPSNAPGQGDDGWGDLFSDSPAGSPVIPNGDAFSGMNSGMDIGSILNGQGNPVAPIQDNASTTQSQGGSLGDKADVLLEKGIMGIGSYIKALFKSLTNNTKRDWNILGERMAKISTGVFILGIIFLILEGTVLPAGYGSINLLVGSGISIIVGLIMVGAFRKGAKPAEEPTPEENTDSTDDFNDDSESLFDDDIWSDDEEDLDESDYGDEDDSVWGDAFSDSSFGDVDDSFFASNDDFDAQKTVDELPEIPQGQYTRQYLYETFLKVLPTIEPSFMDMEDVVEGSDEFMMFEDFMRRSAEQTGVNYDKLDELQLLEVRKNLFIIQLVATRPTGLKEKDIANGIADCYKRDDYGATINGREGVFARVNSQVGRLIIDIFLCNNVMVSLGDIYRRRSDFILDAKNTMPLVWGISEMGNVFCCDGMKDGNGGIIISGEARSGKSWKGQSLIAQMCMFMSPKELEFHFFDVKGEASDYAYLSRVLPHCKSFCGESLQFNDKIETLLEREKKRRTDLLAGKYTNVKDYNKDHPYDKIPTIYIVVDEMATAMAEMKDKDIEIRKKFDSLLIQIATKYPYLEIKLMLFPHRIVNDIINKTVSSMISTRSVMGNVPAEELKSALDIKKDFPYSLVKTGDMAIKTKSLNNGNAIYSHSEVLATNEQVNRKIFDYIGSVWKKIEPDCVTMEDESSAKKSSKGAVDNSVFANDYSYTAKTGNVKQDTFTDSEVDESFWDDALKEPDEDDFWNKW